MPASDLIRSSPRPLCLNNPLINLPLHFVPRTGLTPLLVLTSSLFVSPSPRPDIPGPAVMRSPVRNIQVFNPTTNTLNVRWEAATGPVVKYRVVYSPLNGARPSESVSAECHP